MGQPQLVITATATTATTTTTTTTTNKNYKRTSCLCKTVNNPLCGGSTGHISLQGNNVDDHSEKKPTSDIMPGDLLSKN